jgi:predicted P-loop ATPase
VPVPQHIPQQLLDLPQWVLWRYECRQNNNREWRWTKVPYSYRGGHAKTTDPATWGEFALVWSAYKRGGFDGIGICLAEGDGLVGLDLDHCVEDGIVSRDEALSILNELDTYVEFSPSGEGLRAFCYGEAPETGKRGENNWIEVYDYSSPRYLTLTGARFNSLNVESAQRGLDWLDTNFPKRQKPKPLPRQTTPVSLDDQELLDKARRASNGSAFVELYEQGNVGSDWSSADLALCNMLAFWTGCDIHQMDRLFRASALYRPKWDEMRGEQTYGQLTLDKAISDCSETYQRPESMETTTQAVSVEPDSVYKPWEEDMLWRWFKDGGRKLKTLRSNLAKILVHDERLVDVVCYDEFCNDVVSRVAPPWNTDEHGDLGTTEIGTPWKDPDYTRLQCWLEREWGVTFADTHILAVVGMVAHQRTFHPVRDWLDGLVWDGKPRIKEWLFRYLGSLVRKEYVESVGPKWLIACVARIFNPGCKVDNVLILEGGQGAGKSTALRVLIGSEWFTDTPIHISNKDSFLALRGAWVVELAELDSLMRAENSEAKAFFTSAVDRFRPPYGRAVMDFPRQCVFAGTVNHSDYLRDETGGRRYWPVPVSNIKLAELARDREQLWAEAVHAFRAGEKWWLDREDEKLAAVEQEQRITDDPWEEPIVEWLSDATRKSLKHVSISRLLTDAVGMTTEKMGRSHQTRVGRIMTRLGWKRDRKRIDGSANPKTVYVRPPDPGERAT